MSDEAVGTTWRRPGAVIGWLVLLALCAAVVAVAMSRRGSGAGANGAAKTIDASKLADPAAINGRLNIWAWNIAAKSLKSITPGFQQRHPNVAVDIEMSGTIAQTRFLLSLSADTGAPDVMQLQGFEAQRFLATGRLTDLTSVAAKYADDFPAASWANCTRDDGRIFAIPWDIGPCAVFYKPAIFEKHGVDPATIKTWDDFIAAGQHIVRASGGRTKMLPIATADLQYTYELMLQQVGGQIFDADGRVVIHAEPSRRVLDLIRRMIDAGICANVRPWTHDWMAGFGGDTIATYPAAVWTSGTIKDTVGTYGAAGNGGWRVFPLPSFARQPGAANPEVSGAANMGGSVLAIPDQCTQKEAAWAFIEYALCTREGQLAQLASYDLFPAYLPALKDPFVQQPDPFYGGQPVRTLFAARVTDVPVLNRTEDWVEAITYANQTFSRWANNREDTGEMLDTLAEKLARRLGRPLGPKSSSSSSSSAASASRSEESPS